MDERCADYLKAEYLALQAHYEAFDNRTLMIKSWGTLLVSGAIAFGLKEASIAILVVAAVAASGLWLLEAIWKSFQYCHTDRLKAIEAWFRGENSFEPMPPFQIFTEWGKLYDRHFHKWSALWPILKERFVFLPYAPVILLALGGIGWLLIIGEEG